LFEDNNIDNNQDVNQDVDKDIDEDVDGDVEEDVDEDIDEDVDEDINEPDLPSSESQIQNFGISLGRIQPNFTPDTFLYNITIPDNTVITATITLPENLASLKINNSDIEDFTNPFTYSFSGNIQSFTILCIAEDTLTTNEYTFNVHKAENNIFNHSFEEVLGSTPLGWTMKSAGALTVISDDFALSSIYSAAFNTLTQAVDGREALSEPILYSKGSDIILMADIFIPKADNLTSADVRFSLKLYFFTDADCQIPAQRGHKTLNSVSPIISIWENIRLTCRADELSDDTLYIRAAIRANYISGGARDSLHRFDNVVLYQF